uniref:Serine aminopeptidase S33 domain-containing protein n=1 Tax=Oryza punctata TaxID=4537 RepID=A0A0E0KDY4_ORYPU
MDQLVNFIIRPPRAEYSPNDDLLEQEFMLKGRWFQRKDLEVVNGHGKKLQCSHYMPVVIPEGKALPCVIYCHGNSGCRADASEAAIILLPSNITVFTLDFSGSGLSEGEHVTLGWNEREDLKAVVNHLRTDGNISCIGLWGRSMGAVTSLMYGAEDPSIAGMVLDSPFSNLVDLMMELVDTYKYPLPKFTVKLAIQHMRKVVKRKASFDIMDLDTIQVAKRCFVPALFGHATEDDFILPHHSDKIYESYVGDKNIIKFDGDHNSPRPQFYFDSITIFFHNVLNPPDVPDDHYFLTPHGSLGQGHWDTEHDIEYRFAQSPTARAATTEDAIAQLRSRRLMSRMEVPTGATAEDRADRNEVMDSDNGPSSSSVSTATPPNGRNGRLLTPTSDDGEYVEYSFDSLSDMPYTEEDEDRMLMRAIMESLKDLELSNTKAAQSVASDAASKENKEENGCNGATVTVLEPDASSTSARPTPTDAPGKDVTTCSTEAKSPQVQSAGNHTTNNTASANTSSSSESNASTHATNGKSASSESQKPTQNANGEDGTRATLVVQKSRTGSLIDGLTHKWGSLFKNND